MTILCLLNFEGKLGEGLFSLILVQEARVRSICMACPKYIVAFINVSSSIIRKHTSYVVGHNWLTHTPRHTVAVALASAWHRQWQVVCQSRTRLVLGSMIMLSSWTLLGAGWPVCVKSGNCKLEFTPHASSIGQSIVSRTFSKIEQKTTCHLVAMVGEVGGVMPHSDRIAAWDPQ